MNEEYPKQFSEATVGFMKKVFICQKLFNIFCWNFEEESSQIEEEREKLQKMEWVKIW